MTKLFMSRSALLIFLSVASRYCCLAQISANDTSFLRQSKKAAFNFYSKAIGDQANLYNGSEYRGYITRDNTVGDPYFLTDDWTDGSVYYDSSLYTNIPLLYEVVNDKVILDHPFGHFKVELIGEKIPFFDLAGHHFVRLLASKSDSSVRTGFYDVLYSGNTKVYVKRKKQIEQTIESGAVKVTYAPKDKIYIYKDSKFYHVRTRASVLKVFADRKKDLRKLISQHKAEINFKKRRDETITLIARLYDETEKHQ